MSDTRTGFTSAIAKLRDRTTDPDELQGLLKTIKGFHPKSDLDPVRAAYQVALSRHAGQQRLNGEPYITHPLAVAQVLADLGLTPATVSAALLHDVVEDTDFTIEQVKETFGEEVALLVDGVTKLDRVTYGPASAAETVRKMLVAMAQDIRVLVIKLADRLHNMRTLGSLPLSKQEEKSRETLEIYAPLAHRLGLNTLKWELEDRAFATLQPKIYGEVVKLVEQRAPERESELATITNVLNKALKGSSIKASVTGRPKHFYSIYQKMIVRSRDFNEIYDLIGVRVLVKTVQDCYAALGAIHAQFTPVPGRFKDYIASPKFTMYRSLHTTVIGPLGKPIEVQIRTEEMHREAEYGVASHWRYKDFQVGGRTGPDDPLWLKQIVDWQRESQDPSDFLESLRFDIAEQEVFVFTPKGDVIALPAGATPVDFAYSVHTDVGHHCVGAKVNGRLVPLDAKLVNGDVIDVLISKSSESGPSRDWLNFVVSGRARSKIRNWFSREQREEQVEMGREAIARMARRQGLPLQRLLTNDALIALCERLRFKDVTTLYAAVGQGHTSAATVVRQLIELHGGEEGASEDLTEVSATRLVGTSARAPIDDTSVVVEGLSDVQTKLARCCMPVPGDEILGFVTRGEGVSVHRTDCTNADDLRAKDERIIDVSWGHTGHGVFMVRIQVEALDREGLLSDVTKALTDQRVNIVSGSIFTRRDRVAFSRFTFEMSDVRHLDTVLSAVREVEGVYEVSRA